MTKVPVTIVMMTTYPVTFVITLVVTPSPLPT